MRQAYQRILLQDIYRAQNLERIVETGSCTCNIRFPDWEGAEATFRERHARVERWKILQASDRYSQRANEVRLAAKAICDAAGDWSGEPLMSVVTYVVETSQGYPDTAVRRQNTGEDCANHVPHLVEKQP